jgi:hypothetical protein
LFLRISITRKWTRGLLAGALALALAACSDESTTDAEGESVPIVASHIIVNPKSPAPGDTIRLTVDLESDTVNIGDFPTVAWTASGGTFLESNETSVRWIAPATSALYDINVTASNTVSTTSLGTTVFVGQSVEIVAAEAGQPFFRPNGVDFVYMRTPNIGSGIEMYEYAGGIASDLVPGEGLGENISVAPSLTGAAYEIETPPLGNFIEPINVVYSDLVAGVAMPITSDQAQPGSRRRHQYTRPSFSADGKLIAYQGYRPATLATEIDSVDVFVYNTATQATTIATRTHGLIRKNFFPTISPDGKWLVFVADRSALNRWEFYGLPIANDVVATESAATVRLTNTNGTVTSGSLVTIVPPFMKWSHVDPVMALVSSTGVTSQITFGPSGATLTPVTGVGSRIVREFVWSGDGTMLAMTDGETIFSVPRGGGVATAHHTGTTGDLLRDLTWSQNLDYIIYRVTRGSSAWFELLDVSAGRLTRTVVLTPATSAGEVGAYRRFMSTSALYTSADELMMLLFANATPSIHLLDISGAVQ